MKNTYLFGIWGTLFLGHPVPCLAQFAPVCPDWSQFALIDPIWPHLALFGLFWHRLSSLCPVWPHRINLYERKGLGGTPEDHLLGIDRRLKKGLRTMSTIQVENDKKVSDYIIQP